MADSWSLGGTNLWIWKISPGTISNDLLLKIADSWSLGGRFSEYERWSCVELVDQKWWRHCFGNDKNACLVVLLCNACLPHHIVYKSCSKQKNRSISETLWLFSITGNSEEFLTPFWNGAWKIVARFLFTPAKCFCLQKNYCCGRVGETFESNQLFNFFPRHKKNCSSQWNLRKNVCVLFSHWFLNSN